MAVCEEGMKEQLERNKTSNEDVTRREDGDGDGEKKGSHNQGLDTMTTISVE